MNVPEYLVSPRCRIPEIPKEMTADALMRGVYSASGKNNDLLAIDLVLEICWTLLPRKSDVLDACLERSDVDRMSSDAMIAMLMETFRVKAILPHRADFYRRVEARLRDLDPENSDEMMTGLK